MKEYHKINSVYMRDHTNRFIEGEWACPEFDYLQNNIWEFTEKVDGTNIRIMIDGENITFGGKTDNAQIPSKLTTVLNNAFLTITQRQTIKNVFDCPVCLYGEGYGSSIQKGGGNYKPNGVAFVLFDVRIGDWWLKRDAIDDIAQKLGLDTVPVIGEGTLHDGVAKVKAGIKSRWGEFEAEGIVLRPKVALLGRNRERIITKLKHRDFK